MSSTAQGRLVAHPDISLVLRGTDMKRLPQVAAALAAPEAGNSEVDATNLAGVSVLSAHAEIPALKWLVFVEVPTIEAQQPVIDAGLRGAGAAGAGPADRRLGRRAAGAAHGGADPRAAGRRRAHRRRRARPSPRRSRPATSWRRWPTSSTARPRRSRNPTPTLEQRVDDRTRELTRVARAADRDGRDPAGDLAARRPTCSRCWTPSLTARMRLLQGRQHASSGATTESTQRSRGRDGLPGSTRRRLAGTLVRREPQQLGSRRRCRPDAPSTDRPCRRRQHAGCGSAIARAPRAGAPCIGRADDARGQRDRRHHAARAEAERLHDQRRSRSSRPSPTRPSSPSRTSACSPSCASRLEQQTASAEILQVISQSPTDVQPVLDAVVKAAVRFCGADDASITCARATNSRSLAHDGSCASTVGMRRPLDRQPVSGGPSSTPRPAIPRYRSSIRSSSPRRERCHGARLARRTGRADAARGHRDRQHRAAQVEPGPSRRARSSCWRLSPPRP